MLTYNIIDDTITQILIAALILSVIGFLAIVTYIALLLHPDSFKENYDGTKTQHEKRGTALRTIFTLSIMSSLLLLIFTEFNKNILLENNAHQVQQQIEDTYNINIQGSDLKDSLLDVMQRHKQKSSIEFNLLYKTRNEVIQSQVATIVAENDGKRGSLQLMMKDGENDNLIPFELTPLQENEKVLPG